MAVGWKGGCALRRGCVTLLVAAARGGGGGGARTGKAPGTVLGGRTHCGQGGAHSHAGSETLLVQNADWAGVDVAVVSGGEIFAELEDVGPGTTRPLHVSLKAGPYAVA